MSLVQRLRADTAADHDRVDARYAGFELSDRRDYARFLIAHARALPAVEGALATRAGLPPFRERTSLLAADLADLGEPMPEPFDIGLATDAEAWGALYVIEGSRLGGAMLARRVPAALPSRYLAAKHLAGEWRALIQAIDMAPIDPVEAVDAARRVFDLYRRGADVTP
ncbi:heme oxygenase [Sphingomonas jinjuensis]|uniref:Heme oxygenase n=1 Tax=Sphingomonas jinjuensis TaxID=535907 RepID=A0A840FHN9_9SPHN|nr:biliverdin-producing heme oxygenase [Sphingomonas jinjuensis]MBB4155207.1 heme oxygenase [Sphingomonas jinjuensis]